MSPTSIELSNWERVDALGRMLRADYRYGSAGCATCTAVDLGDKRLVLLSPPGGPQAQALYESLDQQGEVVAVVAPNAFHRLGMPLAAARYPKATLYAPGRAAPRVGRVLPAGRHAQPLEALASALPPDLEIFVPPHMKWPDTVLRLHAPEGVVWTLHDVIINLDVVSSNPVERWLLGLLGYRIGLRLNRFGCRFVLVGDRAAFSHWLVGELARLPPAIFAPGHGPVVRAPDQLARLPGIAAEISGAAPQLEG